jgi:hypothetical protein
MYQWMFLRNRHPRKLASEQTADSSASMVASNGVAPIASSGSGTSNTDGGNIAVAHSVQPIYPTNPKDLDSLVNEVADATAKEMVKQGLLSRQ